MSNPWVVQAPQTAQVPVGSYSAEFAGVEAVALQDGAAKWRFAWTVKTGPEQGKTASALCDCKISPTALPGQLIAGLLGRALQPGENVQAAVEACRGKTYMVSVMPGPKGGKPCVRMVAALPA